VQLFRPEALRGQDRLHGDVVLVPPVSWKVMTLFLLAVLIGAATFLATARYTPVVTARGILTGDAPLSAQLQVPAGTAPTVERGQPVQFTVEGLPLHARGRVAGRIEFVSAGSAPVERTDGSGRADTVLVVATIDNPAALGRERPLRAGMIVEARIATRSRSLAQRLFGPLFAATHQ
jgi:hypothetical protein